MGRREPLDVLHYVLALAFWLSVAGAFVLTAERGEPDGRTAVKWLPDGIEDAARAHAGAVRSFADAMEEVDTWE